MTPKDFLKSKNIPEPTYNGVRLVDNEMESYKITDLLHEYAIEVLKLANGADKSESTCNLQNVTVAKRKVYCGTCKHKLIDPDKQPCRECNDEYHLYEQAT